MLDKGFDMDTKGLSLGNFSVARTPWVKNKETEWIFCPKEGYYSGNFVIIFWEICMGLVTNGVIVSSQG